jgi:hypothetical protein
MPKDQLQNARKASEHFAHVNDYLKTEYIIYGAAGTSMKLLVPRQVAGIGYSSIEDLANASVAECCTFNKVAIQNTPLTDDIESQLAIVNKDGIYETLVWTTTPAHIKTALRAGVFNPRPMQNPLAKMIAQLGDYKQTVFSRSVEDSLIVRHNRKKLEIVDFTQDCLELLQPLHFCINNYDDGVSPHENLEVLIKKLDKLIDNLAELKMRHPQVKVFYLNLYGHVNHLINEISTYKAALSKRLNNKHHPVKKSDMLTILQTYSNPMTLEDLSLQHFIQSQLNSIVTHALEMNYVISGLFQDTSGLHRVIMETIFLAENFSSDGVDYHNPFTPQHAFDFSEKANAQGLVTLDMSLFGFVPDSKSVLARQAAVIERIDRGLEMFDITDQQRSLFNISLGDVLQGPITLITWIINGIKDILGAAADLIYLIGKACYDVTLFSFGYKVFPVNFPSSWSWLLKTDSSLQKYADLPVNQKLYAKYPEITRIPYRSLLQQLYSKATRLLSRYFIDPVVSATVMVKDEFWEFKTLRRIMYDSTIGSRPVNEMGVALLLEQRISEMRANETCNGISQASLITDYMKLEDHQDIDPYSEIEKMLTAKRAVHPHAAVIPYQLTPDKPGDVFTWAIDDFCRNLVEVFSHEMFRGHPVAGLAFTIVACTTAPMAFPGLCNNPFLGPIWKNISLPLAETLIGHPTGLIPAMSTGILQGQIAYFTIDLLNGRTSTLKYGAKVVLENPVIAVVVATAAVSFGYMLAYELNIPWLSKEIVEETSAASFPYFELGMTGAKVAAILLEGTLHLHKEKDEGIGDHYIDNAIDKMRDEIKAVMLKNYLKVHQIKANQLSDENRRQIDEQVDNYCNELKKALKKPDFAAQVNHLSATITTLQEAVNPSVHSELPLWITDVTKQNELAVFLERREKRHQIAELDPANLSEKDKYIILNYLHQTYKDNPQYVAAVRTRLLEEETMGPIAETFKVFVSYPGAFVRAILAVPRITAYWLASVFYSILARHEKQRDMEATVSRTLYPVQEFLRKVRNDCGLLVKSFGSVLRIGWGLVGGLLQMPIILFLMLSSPIVSRKSLVTMFAKANSILFAPGRVSQFIDYCVGKARADAGSKNLRLITRDIDLHDNRKILNPASAIADAAKAPLTNRVTPADEPVVLNSDELEKAVLAIMRDVLRTFSPLAPFVKVNPNNFSELLATLSGEVARGEQFSKLYLFVNFKQAFKTSLKAALLKINTRVKELQGVSFEDRLFYQSQIMGLLQANKRDPIVEFRKAFDSFLKISLPARPQTEGLRRYYNMIVAARMAVNDLKISYDSSKSRSRVVIDLLMEHPCLSIQVVKEISDLKQTIKDMSQNKNTINTLLLDIDGQLTLAKELLKVMEIMHKCSRAAAHRLAVDASIMTALARLHVSSAPASTATLNIPGEMSANRRLAMSKTEEGEMKMEESRSRHTPTLFSVGNRTTTGGPHFVKTEEVAPLDTNGQSGLVASR